MGTSISRFDVKNCHFSPFGGLWQSERWFHREKVSVFQSLQEISKLCVDSFSGIVGARSFSEIEFPKKSQQKSLISRV